MAGAISLATTSSKNNLQKTKRPSMPSFMRADASRLCDNVVENNPLIIMGDSPAKLAQYAGALERLPSAHVMGINRGTAGVCLPELWATMHCDADRLNHRYKSHLPPLAAGAYVIGYECNGDEHECVDLVVSADHIWGTSALLGVLAGLWLGYDEVVLAGVELSGYYGAPSKLASWQAWAPYMQGRVKTMGGALEGIIDKA